MHPPPPPPPPSYLYQVRHVVQLEVERGEGVEVRHRLPRDDPAAEHRRVHRKPTKVGAHLGVGVGVKGRPKSSHEVESGTRQPAQLGRASQRV